MTNLNPDPMNPLPGTPVLFPPPIQAATLEPGVFAREPASRPIRACTTTPACIKPPSQTPPCLPISSTQALNQSPRAELYETDQAPSDSTKPS